MPLPMVSLIIFSFWLKTMDYSQGFWSKLSALLRTLYSSLEGAMKMKFVPFKQLSFPMTSSFVEIVSGQKPWNIVHGKFLYTLITIMLTGRSHARS